MSIHVLAQLRHPARVPWWCWIEIAGGAGLLALAVLLLLGRVPHPVAMAALLHLAADFTFQSPQTARLKARRDRHLLVHALVAGGLPLAVVALVARDPVAVLVWTALGAAAHYAVDWTRKFGLRRLVWGVLLDQGCHLVTLLLLVTLGRGIMPAA
jgi:hypothetical protein